MSERDQIFNAMCKRRPIGRNMTPEERTSFQRDFVGGDWFHEYPDCYPAMSKIRKRLGL